MQAIQLTAVVATWTLAVLAAFAVAGGSLLERGPSGGLRSLAYMFFVGLWLLGAAMAGMAAGWLGVGVFAVASLLSIVVMPRMFTDGESVRKGPLMETLAFTLLIAVLAAWAALGRM